MRRYSTTIFGNNMAAMTEFYCYIPGEGEGIALVSWVRRIGWFARLVVHMHTCHAPLPALPHCCSSIIVTGYLSTHTKALDSVCGTMGLEKYSYREGTL